MALGSLLLAIVLGALQGVLEWLPVSSEGSLAIVLSAMGTSPAAAVRLSLFLHMGTALAAAAYYRGELRALGTDALAWSAREAFDPRSAELSFLGLATLVSVVVALAAYAALLSVATALAGGLFVALVGALLIITGLVQYVADARGRGAREEPDVTDALLVGAGQGLAVLPGVSRSGTTVGLLLLRGHPGEAAFSRSFLLAIPASLGAGVLAVVDAGGLPGLDPTAAVAALAAAAIAGYLTIDLLLRVVRRVPFPAVCVGVGGLAILGGTLSML